MSPAFIRRLLPSLWGRLVRDKCEREVVDDSVHNGEIGKEGNDSHPAAAFVAKHRVDLIHFSDHRGPKCGGTMKVIASINDFQAVDLIIDHLKLSFIAEKPPLSRVYEQVALKAAEERGEYF